MDADGRPTRAGHGYVLGLKRTVSMWLRLYERVQRGELGGERDWAQPSGSIRRLPDAGVDSPPA